MRRTHLPLILLLASVATASPRAALLQADLPNASPASASALADCAKQGGYDVTTISLSDLPSLSPSTTDLLILPNARSLPLTTIPAITSYLSHGGHLLAAGLPAWSDLVTNVNGHYLTRPDYERALNATHPTHTLVNFSTDTPSAWHQSSNDNRPQHLTLPDSTLHVTIDNLTGWSTLVRPFTHPFPKNHTLTCFRAKGSPTTTQLAVEWKEDDGSRWIATVPLSPTWQSYALPPEAFAPWEPPPHRRGPHDHLRPDHATTFSIGLAFSHTDVGRGPHQYWLADLGTAPHPFPQASESRDLPPFEGLSPFYATYPMSDLASCSTPAGIPFLTPVTIPLTTPEPSLQPRPQSPGFNKSRPTRWQPLLEAHSPNNDFRGTLAALLLDTTPPHSARLCLTPTDPTFYQLPQVRKLITETLTSLHQGLYLQEAGCSYYTAFPNQPLPLGARLLRTAHSDPTPLTIHLTITEQQQGGKTVFTQDWPVTPDTNTVSTTWTPTHWPANGFLVTTELLTPNHKVLDRLSHPLHLWQPPSTPHFIQVNNGHFTLNSHPWKPHGLNYMPSSGIGQPNSDLFERWLSSPSYDPTIISRDFDRVRALGFNAVSAFIYRDDMEAQNLLDFLRLCRDRDLHVNLALRPSDPMNFDFRPLSDLLTHYHLVDNDTLFAYDLDWEPTHGNHTHQQKRYSKPWTQWVLHKYGSLQSAEKAWSFQLGTRNQELGTATLNVPDAPQLLNDGPWRKLVSDYRHFLDDLLADKYGHARTLIRSLDPNHSVSFRMNIAGDPTAHSPDMLAYDFFGLKNAVDFFAPEAYGRIGDWTWVKPGVFTASYARLCNPSLPLVWAEVGFTTWDPYAQRPSPAKQQTEAQFYSDIYRMLRESRSDGVFFWWYPGGYRVNERSDFGILNEDGTDRPVTRVIRENATTFLSTPTTLPTPDVTIEVDRDADARGLYGIYDKVQSDYWHALDTGHIPALRWSQSPGTPATSTAHQ